MTPALHDLLDEWHLAHPHDGYPPIAWHNVFWTLAEMCHEHRLPFDLMIGVNRAVYPGGVFQGIGRSRGGSQGQGQQGSQGRTGEARGDTDPLGRPMPQRNEDYGPDKDMLPSELAIRRAREILEMLRSRASEPELPRLERDYIDRLLRGLY